MKLLHHIKQNNLNLCTFLLGLSLLILPYFYSFHIEKIVLNMLFATCIIFIICNFKTLNLQEFKPITPPLIAYFLVIILAYISLFFAADVKESIFQIKKYLWEPLLFMLLAFLLTKRLDSKQFKILLILIFLALAYHPILTIYSFFSSSTFAKLGFSAFGIYRAVPPLHYQVATGHFFYLALAFSFSLSFSIFFKGRLRILFLSLFFITLFSILCNGGRFAFIATIAMAASLLVFFRFRFKILFIFSALVLIAGFIFSYYHISKDFSPRFNLNSMINNFSTIIHTPPAQMGIYYNKCENNKNCSIHSQGPASSLQWEFSSLARLSLAKSTFLAIMQNPLRPNGYHYQQFPFNIQNNFALDSANHPFYLRHLPNKSFAALIHNHNHWLSLAYELGIFGFLSIAFFVSFMLFKGQREAHKAESSTIKKAFILSVWLFMIGLVVSNFFDCMPILDGQAWLFIIIGIYFGVIASVPPCHAKPLGEASTLQNTKTLRFTQGDDSPRHFDSPCHAELQHRHAEPCEASTQKS